MIKYGGSKFVNCFPIKMSIGVGMDITVKVNIFEFEDIPLLNKAST